MQPQKIQEPFQNPTIADWSGVTAPVAELAVLIDAIPSEYRDDVLLAALWLGTNKTFQESYMVGSLRSQLCECLMEKTGTLHDFRTIRQFDRSVVERQLRPLRAAGNMDQIAIAIEALLAFLADAL